MDGNVVGFAAVVMVLGIPMAAMYTFFRIRKLRSEERMAAIARGIAVPMQMELSEAARSRRAGIFCGSCPHTPRRPSWLRALPELMPRQ
jgi:hypothetical protein